MKAKTRLDEYVMVANDSIDKYQEICHSAGIHINTFSHPIQIQEVIDRLEQVDTVQENTHRTKDEQKLVSLERDLHNLKIELEERNE